MYQNLQSPLFHGLENGLGASFTIIGKKMYIKKTSKMLKLG